MTLCAMSRVPWRRELMRGSIFGKACRMALHPAWANWRPRTKRWQPSGRSWPSDWTPALAELADFWRLLRSSGLSFCYYPLTQRNTENASCMSLASSRGCSSAAKWPPTGISVHLATLNTRSIHSRGGLIISLGNRA
jgi:hypothetical protein